ncbi:MULTISPECIES: O-antigen ligase family protein [Calothrix]|uniref:O-antigen ligase domain-containing protein n=2 Tax=Calothrix TaxID=1186 RepID=A0ABR8AJC4_9CYAN|nr:MULTISPECIES: O-antigen ligase family protein [Calothrix]MBD2200058.1 O-antigen ligase domain-containing protein [Calothrix parietina FACHB-288]MBD2229048.1 O-antigen ligase domain-containing protein [Calothrix anomala FACHB-343]
MAKNEEITPRNFEERVVWYTITWTYGLYVVGGLYIAAPVVAWILVFYLCKKLILQNSQTPVEERITIPFGVWIWIISMIVMLVALFMGHFDYNLSNGEIIKSAIGWAKGWALLAIFPLIGCLNIRPELVYRAGCIVCYQTLLFFPFFYIAYLAHLPATLYVSPLKAVGGPGPDFFAMNLYEVDPEAGSARWRLFTPWAPAVGFVANIYFIFAFQEKSKKWRRLGIIGSLLMCQVSASRLALVNLIVVSSLTWVLSRMTRPRVLMILGFASPVIGLVAPSIIKAYKNFNDAFKAARAGSSRVRAALGRIAYDRWESEAPIWGHGVVEKGPHVAEHMPIGSHHSWFGLLFVKGIVGFFALAVPMFWTLIECLIKCQTSPVAKSGLSIIFTLFLYTFGENLEILAYLFWPALVILGIAFKEKVGNPFNQI